ncbi:hypothetical protein KEM55_008999, partial [Ascosphaera atra]
MYPMDINIPGGTPDLPPSDPSPNPSNSHATAGMSMSAAASSGAAKPRSPANPLIRTHAANNPFPTPPGKPSHTISNLRQVAFR